MDKEKLLTVAQQWAEDTISDWFFEYGGWDTLLEDDEISEEELGWIQENITFNIETILKDK
jgi:hypothetical protein